MQYLFMTLAAVLSGVAGFRAGRGSRFQPVGSAGCRSWAWRWPRGFAALAQGKATASSAEALARNPGARPGIFIFLILGLAFIESLALFTFVIIFLKVK